MARREQPILGEDVELVVNYEQNGTAVDPDDQDADASATPDAYITIHKQGASTPLINSAPMTHVATGEFEYVWDTETTNGGTGKYQVDVSADFGGNTDIKRTTVTLA